MSDTQAARAKVVADALAKLYNKPAKFNFLAAQKPVRFVANTPVSDNG